MQRLLNEKEVAKIDELLSSNALLLACQQVWPKMQEEIVSVKACPEDLFCEAAWLIDELIDADESTNAISLVEGLWSKAVSDIINWTEKDVSLSERYLILSTIFRLVAVTFSLHHHSHYCDTLREAILTVIEEKRSQPQNLHEQQQQGRQREKLIGAIIACADFLNEWVNEYIDNPDSWLIDDIQQALTRRTQTKTTFKTTKPDDKKKTNTNYSRYSFKITGKGKFKGKENVLLKLLYNELDDKNFIEDFKDIKLSKEFSHILNIKEKNKIIFNTVFSGADTDYHIVWIGTAKELGYFINQLEERGVLSWKKGPRKWQVTRSRIWQRKKNNETSEATEKPHYYYTYEQFNKNAFNGSLIPNDTTVLDKILDMIALPVEKETQKDICSEINDEFRDYENYEQENENDRGEKLSGAFRDTSHKAME